MTAAAEDLLVRIDATTEQLRREMRRGDQTVAQSSQRMNRSLRRVDQGFNRLNRGVRTATRLLGAFGVALSTRALIRFAQSQIDAAAAIGKAADAAQIGTGSIQELRFAFGQLADVTDREVDQSLLRFNRRLGLAAQGAGAAKPAFDALFGEVPEFRNTEEAFDTVIAQLEQIEDGAERAALASQFFGDRVGPKLAGAIGRGVGSLDRLRREAVETGIVLEDDVIRNAEQIKDEFDRASRIIKTRFMAAINEATPLLIAMARHMERVATFWGRTFGQREERQIRSQVTALVRERQGLMRDLERGTRFGMPLSDEDIRERRERIIEIGDEIGRLTEKLVALEEAQERARPDTTPTPVPAPEPEAVDVAFPEALANLERRVHEQEQLNAALRQNRAEYRAVSDEIARVNAVSDFHNRLVEDEIDNAAELAEQYDEVFRSLQKLEQEYEDLDGALRDAAEANRQFFMVFESALEDAIIDMNDFRDIFRALVEDIQRVFIRQQITGPLVQGLAGAFAPNADGNVFAGGRIQPFARGGIVDSPTLFPMSRGAGLMGEAGPEAIMPLSRTRDGRLGVIAEGGNSVNNVFNFSIDARGADEGVEERIRQAVREGQASTIAQMRRMQQSRGTSRV